MMRFGAFCRPISALELRKLRVHELGPLYLRSVRETDELCQRHIASGWWGRLSKRYSELRLRCLEKSRGRMAAELYRRHQGVLVEIFAASGISPGPDRIKAMAMLRIAVQAAAVRDPSNGSFADLLCHSLTSGIPQRMHLKVHLRGFVDELRDCEQRGVLLATAFGAGVSGAALFNDEAVDLAQEGFEMLASQMLSMGGRIDGFTNGAITNNELGVLESATALVEEWLYG